MSQEQGRDVRVHPDVASLTRAVSKETVHVAKAAVEKKGRFDVALSGGRTPRMLYELWAKEYREQLPWDQAHLFWGDERYLPKDDQRSNYRMVREALLDQLKLPAANVHPMPTDLPQPDDAARAYEKTLRGHFAPGGPDFDLVFLGLGVEGHTASLFPSSPALAEKNRWVVAVRAPVEPPVRLSFTYPVLNSAHNVFFLVTGADKQEIIKTLFHQPAAELGDYPAAQVRPADRLVWFLDQAALG